MKLTKIDINVHTGFREIISITALLVVSGFNHNLNHSRAQQFPGPISMSMGDAGAAGFAAPESALINPAAINFVTPMDVDLIYQDGAVQGDVHRTGLGLLITDNSDDVLFPGAIYYARGSRKFYGQGAEEQLWSVVLGKIYSERLAFGLRVSYLTSKVANGQQHKQLTPGFGTIVTVFPGLSFGLVLENLAFEEVDRNIPQAFRLNPETRLGVRYKPMELFSFLFDVSRREKDNPDKEGAIHVGIESQSNAYSLVRVGAKWDDHAKQNFFTLGAGFDGPRLKMNYSLQKAMKGSDGALHGVDFRVTF